MSKANIISLRNGLGKWITTNLKTASLAKHTVAKICVEMNIQEELPKQI